MDEKELQHWKNVAVSDTIKMTADLIHSFQFGFTSGVKLSANEVQNLSDERIANSGLFRFSHQCDDEDWKKVRVIRDTLEFIAKRVKEEKLNGSS